MFKIARKLLKILFFMGMEDKTVFKRVDFGTLGRVKRKKKAFISKF